MVKRVDLEGRGFEGWIPLLTADLATDVPNAPGIYAVTYGLGRPTIWPEFSCGGRFKGKDPSLTSIILDREWVDDCDIVYIGKTDQTLRKRIKAFACFGRGQAVAHWGGRLIWQLPDPTSLEVGWLCLPAGQASAAEADALSEFKSYWDRLPFANLRH